MLFYRVTVVKGLGLELSVLVEYPESSKNGLGLESLVWVLYSVISTLFELSYFTWNPSINI